MDGLENDPAILLQACMRHTIMPRVSTVIEAAQHLIQKHQLGAEHLGAVIVALAIEHQIFEEQ